MCRRLPFILFGVTVLAACQTTQGALNTYPQGKTVHSVFAIGDVQVPLPEGEWTVAGTGEFFNNKRTPMGRVFLLQTDGKTIKKAIYLATTLGYGGGWGYVTMPTCERRDLLHVEKIASYAGSDQDCWWVSHTRPRFADKQLKQKAYADTDRFMKSRGLVMPVTAIYVGYYFANQLRFLHVDYYFNPEVEGFAAPVHSEWQTNDWHRDHLAEDPAKVAYVEKLKAWGKAWHDKVKLGFSRKLAAQGS